jgi:hypothetical protein
MWGRRDLRTAKSRVNGSAKMKKAGGIADDIEEEVFSRAAVTGG